MINYIHQEISSAGPDPRCPHCGRPVLGTFVQGNEGRYHPACTNPPLEYLTPIYEQPQPAQWPDGTVICEPGFINDYSVDDPMINTC